MNYKIATAIFTLLGLCSLGLLSTPTYADDLNTGTVSSDSFDTTTPTDNFSTDSATPSEPSADSTPDTTPEEDNSAADLENTIDHEGTSGEPEVVCADPTEPGCSDPAVEEQIDPELWPLIISLAALGATILFVIIINIISRKKR